MKSLCIFVLILLISAQAFAWPPSTKESEDAGIKMLSMAQTGHVVVDVNSGSVSIEPLGWQGFTHNDKVQLTKTALVFFYGLGEQNAKYKQPFVFVYDKTSRDVLATGFMKTGVVEVKK